MKTIANPCWSMYKAWTSRHFLKHTWILFQSNGTCTFSHKVSIAMVYRHLDSYDFVGRMGPTFYHDMEHLGRQFRGTLPDALEKVFHISDRLNNTNQGIETSASSHVLDYYTPKTLRQVLEYFAIDYMLLDIPIPDWAKQVLEQEGDERKSSQNYDWRIPNKTLRMVNSS